MIGYVARDKNGSLFVYSEEPIYNDNYEAWSSLEFIPITEQSILDKFKDLTYTDNPIAVEIKIELL